MKTLLAIPKIVPDLFGVLSVFGLIGIICFASIFNPVQFITLFCAVFLLAAIAGVWMFRKLQASSQDRKLVAIPEYRLPEDVYFYEVGSLIDGEVRINDLLANFMLHKLFPDRPKSQIDQQLEDILLKTGGIDPDTQRIARKYDSEKRTPNSYTYKAVYVDYTGQAKRIIREKMQQDGFLLFDGFKWRSRLLGWAFYLTFGLGILGIMLLVTVPILFDLILPFGTLLVLALIGMGALAEPFSRNYAKLSRARRDLRGHKIYLQTAEYYRVVKDETTFRELIPYFIAYNLHLDKVGKALVEYDLLNEPGDLEDFVRSQQL